MSPSKVSTVKWDEFSNIINGQQRGAKSQHHGVNPVTGEKLWAVPIGTQQDVNEAVEAAKTAFESFKNTTLAERKEMIAKLKDALMANADDMTELLCAETGKPVRTNTFGKSEITALTRCRNQLPRSRPRAVRRDGATGTKRLRSMRTQWTMARRPSPRDTHRWALLVPFAHG